jgi:mRNA-degrading endonuclease RelE of RelBE toxin-antitoxin system
MHDFEIKPGLHKKLVKLSKKDKSAYEEVMGKIDEIIMCSDIEHYKNLRYDMKDSKRVHIGHFVLVFSFDKARDLISFEDYNHHDKIYRK